MPDFAIIPELPVGYPINGRMSVARIVSVHTVVVSQVPTAVFPATETGLFIIVSTVGLPIARPGDQLAKDLTAPSVPRVATETDVFPYVSVAEATWSSPSDSYAIDLTVPSVPAVVTERASADVRTA